MKHIVHTLDYFGAYYHEGGAERACRCKQARGFGFCREDRGSYPECGCLATLMMRQSAMTRRRIQMEREFHAKRAKESGYIKEEGSAQTQDPELYTGMKTNLFGKLVIGINILYCVLSHYLLISSK